MGFFIPFFTNYQGWGCQIIFLSWKKNSTPQVIMLNRIGVFSLELLERQMKAYYRMLVFSFVSLEPVYCWQLLY